MKKRVLALLMTLCLALTLLPVTALAVDENWIDFADTGWYDGQQSPYTISDAAELAGLAKLVNDGTDNFSGKTIKLDADIDLGGKEWTPIGTSGKPFQGTFDGAKDSTVGGGNHTISNLSINKEFANTVANSYVGLFGYTNSPAVIKNVNFENVDIQGSLYVGTVVGYGFTGSEISNCHVSGKIEIDGWWYIGGIGGNGYVSKVADCTVTGSEGSYIKANNQGSYVGGIWGYRGEGNATISGCTVENIAISGMDRVGGISGIAHYGNTIQSCTIADSTITTENNMGTTGLIAGADLSSGTSIAKILDCTVTNTTATSAGVSVTTKVGAKTHEGRPATNKATVGSDVTFDSSGKVTGGLLEQVDDSMIADGLRKGATAADGAFELIPENDTAVAKVGYTYYTSLTDAFAALNENNHSLILLDDSAWSEDGDIYWQAGAQSGYGDSLRAAVEAAASNGGTIILVCKPNADIADSSAHINVTKDITIYANGAEFGGDDLSIGTYAAPENTSTTVNIYCAKNLVVWGQPVGEREDVWNVNFIDCENDGWNLLMYRGSENGKAKINLTLTGCKASGYNDSTIHTSADGSIRITGCTFENNCAPVNIAHKQAGAMEVIIENSNFTGCGSTSTANDLNQYAAPIRFVNNGTGTLTAVVDGVTITGTVGENGDILLGEGRTGKTSTLVSATITGTNAIVQVQYPGDWDNGTLNENVAKSEVTASSGGTFSNAVAKIGDQGYTSLVDAIDNAQSGDTIELIGNVTLADDTSFAINKKIHLVGVEVNGKKPSITVHYTGTANKGLFTFQDGSAGSGIENLQINITAEATGKRSYAVLFDNYTDTKAQTVIRDVDFLGDDALSDIGAQIGIASAGDADGGNVLVSGCTFTNFCYGVYMDSISNFVFNGNTINGTKYNAVNLGENGGSNIAITNNTFTNISYGNYDDPQYSSGIAVGKYASGVTIENNSISMLNNKLPIYIAEDTAQVIVTFRDEDTIVAQYLVASDETVTIPAAPTKDGYTFQGWYDESGSKLEGTTYIASVDTIFTARWSYNGGGSSGGSTPTYTSTVASTANGSVTVSPKNASKGATVTITVAPNEGYALDTITVTDKDGKSVELTKVSDTKYTFKMPGSAVTVKAAFAEKPDESKLPFTDVAESAWYYDAVSYVYENGMMTGTNDGTTFSPAMNLTRGMMAQVLYNIEKGTAGTAGTFTDVASDAWYADAVNWAAAKGIVNGYGNGKFGPEDSITREQMAVLLYNYAKFKGYDMTAAADLTSFSDDEQVSDWAEYAMQWAVAEKLIQGSNNALNPLGTASRAEVAQILTNFGQNVTK